jgi:FkbM family methyltransferase
MSARDLVRKVAVKAGVREGLLQMGRRLYPPDRPFVKQVEVAGVHFLVLANEDVGRRLAVLGRYEPWDSSLLASLVKPTDVCVDVGANTGFYTLLLASRAVSGEVHAFEPMVLNWHLASVGAILNGFQNVTVNRCSVGDRNGVIEFSEAIDGAYSSLRPAGRKAESRRVEVPIQTLDDYVTERGIPRVDVLKVDVEGAEGMVLNGADRVFDSAASRPRVAMLELYDPNLAPFDLSVDLVTRRMVERGYQPFFAREGGGCAPFSRDQYNVHQNVFFLAEEARRQVGHA